VTVTRQHEAKNSDDSIIQQTLIGTGKITNTIVVSDTAYTLPPVFKGKSWRRVERRPGLCRVAGDCRSRTGAPPLHLRRRTKETGGGRWRPGPAGGRGELRGFRPGGRVVERDRSGRGGQSASRNKQARIPLFNILYGLRHPSAMGSEVVNAQPAQPGSHSPWTTVDTPEFSSTVGSRF